MCKLLSKLFPTGRSEYLLGTNSHGLYKTLRAVLAHNAPLDFFVDFQLQKPYELYAVGGFIFELP